MYPLRREVVQRVSAERKCLVACHVCSPPTLDLSRSSLSAWSLLVVVSQIHVCENHLKGLA